MDRSKLEIEIDILRILAQNGPLSAAQIRNKTYAKSGAKKSYLDFLVKYKLIKRRTSKRKGRKPKISYSIAEKGQAVVKLFDEIDESLQMQVCVKE